MARKKKQDEEMEEKICSFCGKSSTEVNEIVVSDSGIAICSECVKLCQDIIDSSGSEEGSSITSIKDIKKPAEIKQLLDEYIISQDEAKRKVAVAVYNHYKRVLFNSSLKSKDIPIEKSNILMIGGTGVGKTAIWKVIAKMMKVPLVIADSTAITSAGYVGLDASSVLVQAFKDADYDLELAEKAIIIFDEADKLARKSGETASGTKDVSGEAVQQGLLKMIEGTTMEIAPDGKRSPQAETITIDTSNILFVFNGSFEGIEKIIQERMNKSEIGFGKNTKDYTKDEYFSNVLPQDLIKFGMLPELVGRSPVIVTLNDLTEEHLVRILTEPKDAIVTQYKELFNIDGVKLSITDDALREIAKLSINRKTSARGLRAIMESMLNDIMFEYPQKKNLKEIVITKEVVEGMKLRK